MSETRSTRLPSLPRFVTFYSVAILHAVMLENVVIVVTYHRCHISDDCKPSLGKLHHLAKYYGRFGL